MKRLSQIILVGIVLSAIPQTGWSSVFDIYGFGPRGIGMGGAMTASANDHTAAYYNPAALTVPKKIILSLGFVTSLPKLKINRSLLNPKYPSVKPGFFAGFTVGLLFPIGGPLKNKLALGVSIYFPFNKLIGIEGVDPQFPQFYTYQRSPDKLIVVAAVAYEPVKYVSFGLGIQVLGNLFGDVSLNVDILNDQLKSNTLTVEVRPTANFTAGVLVRPFKGLNLGVSYRASLAVTFRLPTLLKLGDPIALDLNIFGTTLYSPHQINFGVSYHFGKPDLTISIDIDYAFWNKAPDPSPQIRVDVGGKLIDGLGLADAIDIGRDAPLIDMRFKDTLTYRLGIEYGPLHWLKVRTGYFYRPSPVPDQSQAYNYLDNDTHGMSLGVSFKIPDPLEVHRRPFSVDLAAQVLLLPSRTAIKQDRLDPVGDLSFSGVVYSFSFSLRHDF